MRAMLERVRGLWARLLRKRAGWGGEPVDDGHAYYRTQYERLVEVLPTLPRGISHPEAHERKNTILAFAQILDGLHNYGDDPIMPPGVRRIVVRESGARLAQFGAIGQPSGLLGFLAGMGPLLPWIMGGALLFSVTGWGSSLWNGWRAGHLERRLETAESERDALEASRNAYARSLTQERAEHARDVAGVLEDTARTVEQLQRREARNRARAERERSRHEELATGSVDFRERLRELAEPADAGHSAPAAAAPGGDPAGGVSAGARPDPDADGPR